MRHRPSGARAPREAAPANDRLKTSFSAWLWTSMIAATVVHFATFALWPTLTAEVVTVDAEILTLIDVPTEIDLPEPPDELHVPATPVVSPVQLDDDVTIGKTTLAANPPDALPLPPSGGEMRGLRTTTLVPYTVAPAIVNGPEIVRALERAYPAFLRDAGIGGTVQVLVHIDENGEVQDVRLDESSGHQALDRAAQSVATLYRFSPALNRDQRVAVWVSFPIVFRVRE